MHLRVASSAAINNLLRKYKCVKCIENARKCRDALRCKISGKNPGGAKGQPPPSSLSVNWQLIGNVWLCWKLKAIEYTQISRKSYWMARQLIRLSHYL